MDQIIIPHVELLSCVCQNSWCSHTIENFTDSSEELLELTCCLRNKSVFKKKVMQPLSCDKSER